MLNKRVATQAMYLIALAGLFGCQKATAPAAAPTQKVAVTGHSHDGWWCDAHGVPEEVCALCDSKVADKMKSDGDWCKEHDRPESQCFVCHPEKEKEFAAQYEAKYGKAPPKPSDAGEGHGHDHDHDHDHAHEHDAKG